MEISLKKELNNYIIKLESVSRHYINELNKIKKNLIDKYNNDKNLKYLNLFLSRFDIDETISKNITIFNSSNYYKNKFNNNYTDYINSLRNDNEEDFMLYFYIYIMDDDFYKNVFDLYYLINELLDKCKFIKLIDIVLDNVTENDPDKNYINYLNNKYIYYKDKLFLKEYNNDHTMSNTFNYYFDKLSFLNDLSFNQHIIESMNKIIYYKQEYKNDIDKIVFDFNIDFLKIITLDEIKSIILNNIKNSDLSINKILFLDFYINRNTNNDNIIYYNFIIELKFYFENETNKIYKETSAISSPIGINNEHFITGNKLTYKDFKNDLINFKIVKMMIEYLLNNIFKKIKKGV